MGILIDKISSVPAYQGDQLGIALHLRASLTQPAGFEPQNGFVHFWPYRELLARYPSYQHTLMDAESQISVQNYAARMFLAPKYCDPVSSQDSCQP